MEEGDGEEDEGDEALEGGLEGRSGIGVAKCTPDRNHCLASMMAARELSPLTEVAPAAMRSAG